MITQKNRFHKNKRIIKIDWKKVKNSKKTTPYQIYDHEKLVIIKNDIFRSSEQSFAIHITQWTNENMQSPQISLYVVVSCLLLMNGLIFLHEISEIRI